MQFHRQLHSVETVEDVLSVEYNHKNSHWHGCDVYQEKCDSMC
jgi:hypothetical protein